MTELPSGSALESADDPTRLRRVAIDPVSRVEGHGKVTLLLDEHNRVQQARLHIVEFRGFEKFIEGRPYWEVPVLVQRLCGICPSWREWHAGTDACILRSLLDTGVACENDQVGHGDLFARSGHLVLDAF